MTEFYDFCLSVELPDGKGKDYVFRMAYTVRCGRPATEGQPAEKPELNIEWVSSLHGSNDLRRLTKLEVLLFNEFDNEILALAMAEYNAQEPDEEPCSRDDLAHFVMFGGAI
jgi:hypothetical protein